MHNLFKHTKPVRVPPDGTAATTWILAAGTTDVNTGSVDTRGFTSIAWLVLVGVITATGTLDVKAQQSSDDGVGDGFSDLLGSAATQFVDTDDGKMALIDIGKVDKRYQRLHLNRETANVVIDGVVAILYNGDELPPALHATVKGLETFNTPAEGTA